MAGLSTDAILTLLQEVAADLIGRGAAEVMAID